MTDFPERAQNFRTLGGIATAGGGRVRAGVVFRSGDISDLSDTCRARLSALGIKALVDLRSAGERRRRPYDWGKGGEIDQWGHAAEESAAAIRALIERADGTTEEVRAAMTMLYRKLPFSHASSYAVLFQWLADGRTPLLFTCSAGKDRTGVAAALLLWALGVARADIVSDYLRSNEALEGLKVMIADQYRWNPQTEQVEAVLAARADYLDGTFAEVERRCGSIETYLARELGLDAAALARLRDVLCD